MGTVVLTRPASETRGLGGAYRHLWWANAVDNLGDGIWASALPLLAATLSRDARVVALVSAFTYLPWLLLSLPVGALVDRADPIALMRRSQWFQCAVAGAMALAVAAHAAQFWMLYACGFLLGCAEVVVGNAAQSVLPELVRSDQLVQANARQSIAQTVSATFLGPPLGSLLFAVVAWVAFGANAVSFGISALFLLRLRRRTPHVRPSPAGARLWPAIVEGLRWLLTHRLLRVVALVFALNCLTNQLAMSTVVLLALQHYGMSDSTYGLLMLGVGVGGLLGGVVAGALIRRLGTISATIASLAVGAATYLFVPYLGSAAALAAVLGVSALSVTIWNVTTVSLRQRVVPAGMIGRVNSVYRMLGWGLFPVGAVLGGLLAHGLGVTAPFPVAGAIRFAVLLAALPTLWPLARDERQSSP